MPLTFQQLKVAVRSRVFAAGEARNQRPAHDKSIVDALVDLQRWVECLQANNTHLVPHCSTYYNCGLTSFDFPRSIVKRLSVIDKINPETHKEDATAADDYCTEIEYRQIDACHMRSYLGKSRSAGCCYPFYSFFAIPYALCNGKATAPVPTDVGVPAGLVPLPLGYHYPQESTNAACGRAMSGVWAIENGRILVAPWIQTTETVVIKWQGIKRDWTDADLVDDDPGLIRAVEMFLRWEHARDWDKNPQVGLNYEGEYRKALAELMYDCAQENMVRSCESGDSSGSAARGIVPSVKLYFNDALPAVVAHCPGNTTGLNAVETIEAGTVSSLVSVGDANALAVAAARARAEARLVCTEIAPGGTPGGTGGTVWKNDPEHSYSASITCLDSWIPSTDAPKPTTAGGAITVGVPVGSVSSTVSQDDANDRALAAFNSLKITRLIGQCTYHNSSQTATAECVSPSTGENTVTVSAGDPDCDSTVSQGAANNNAYEKALKLAKEGLSCTGPVPPIYYNVARVVSTEIQCAFKRVTGQPPRVCTAQLIVRVTAGVRTGATQTEANQKADDLGMSYFESMRQQVCLIIASRLPPPGSGTISCSGMTKTVP